MNNVRHTFCSAIVSYRVFLFAERSVSESGWCSLHMTRVIHYINIQIISMFYL